ncbi:G-protein coupled receptor [Biomphalaria glabrata]|nr:G-protein coupled receptor [Biomphalaria glabrata]
MDNKTVDQIKVPRYLFNYTYTWELLYCWSELESQEQYVYLNVMFSYIFPTVSILGFIANGMSLAILRRSGLDKPSNVLLFGVVIADTMCLCLTFNFTPSLILFGPNKPYPIHCGLQYDESLDYFLLFSSLILTFFGFCGLYTSTAIPVLITFERLLAVFTPLKFRNVVTIRRTVIVVVSSFIFWVPVSVFYNTYSSILIEPMPGNVKYAVSYFGDFYYENKAIIELVQFLVMDFFASWIPLSIIILGCSVLWVKVKITLLKRQHLTLSQSKIPWSPRTTRTLVLSCAIFAVTHGLASMLQFILPSQTIVQYEIKASIFYILYALNSSSNFFVYVASNSKLYQIFINIVSGTK